MELLAAFREAAAVERSCAVASEHSRPRGSSTKRLLVLIRPSGRKRLYLYSDAAKREAAVSRQADNPLGQCSQRNRHESSPRLPSSFRFSRPPAAPNKRGPSI